MNNKSGTIYVIGEKEDESNSHTLFYKCGIVRDGTGRDSHIRLLEHQTGNPRKLVVVETISAPFVEYVGTNWIRYVCASIIRDPSCRAITAVCAYGIAAGAREVS